MRLIDADALLHEIGELKKSPWFNGDYCGSYSIRKEAVEIIEDLCIKDAPTVDAVEVVRCYKCRYSEDTNDYQDSYFCNNPTHNRMHLVHSFDYCSYGARMDGEL